MLIILKGYPYKRRVYRLCAEPSGPKFAFAKQALQGSCFYKTTTEVQFRQIVKVVLRADNCQDAKESCSKSKQASWQNLTTYPGKPKPYRNTYPRAKRSHDFSSVGAWFS